MDKQKMKALSDSIVLQARQLAHRLPGTVAHDAALANLKHHVQELERIENDWMNEIVR